MWIIIALLHSYSLLIFSPATISAKWSESQFVTFEQSLVQLADQFFPFDKTETEFLKSRKQRSSTVCPGGNGKFGFNSYSMMTSVIMGFNAVSNVIANINNNLNNNNNNNNQNDVGNIQGTSQVTFDVFRY
jgi:hypothetical protein